MLNARVNIATGAGGTRKETGGRSCGFALRSCQDTKGRDWLRLGLRLQVGLGSAIHSGSVSGIAIETILHSAPEALKVQQQRDLFASHRRRQLRPRSLFCSPSKLLHLIVDVDVIVALDVFAARFVALDTEILSCETASNTRFHL
ncbi:hypothetical protein ACLKA6_008611 [Drosophila palustris]